MKRFDEILSGGDLRSIGKTEAVVLSVKDQNAFDELFTCLFHKDRLVIMRAADAIEKITINHAAFLTKHKQAILELGRTAKNKELKWHLALLIPRLNLSDKEIETVWPLLTNSALDKKESRLVRVNSIQALYDIAIRRKEFMGRFELLLAKAEKENIPSINARIRKLKAAIHD
jgi:hypothetical protein